MRVWLALAARWETAELNAFNTVECCSPTFSLSTTIHGPHEDRGVPETICLHFSRASFSDVFDGYVGFRVQSIPAA